MARDRAARRARWRSAAVCLALVAGVGATVATTPPLEKCPNPPDVGEVSEFYGPQEYDQWWGRSTTPAAFVGGGFEVRDASVSGETCVTADDPSVEVRVYLEMAGEQVPAVPEETLRTLTISDGAGRVWAPSGASSGAWEPPASEGADPYAAYAHISFLLPADVAGPVTLHLGELSGPTVDELSLDPPAPSPSAS